MKRERSGVCLLLGLLLCFSVSVGMLYGDKKKQEQEDGSSGDGLEALSLEQDMDILRPLLISHSIEKFVEAMKLTSSSRAYDILKLIVEMSNILTRDETIEIIYGVTSHYPDSKDVQFKLLDLILDHPHLQQGSPLIFVAAKSSFPHIIQLLLEWAENRSGRNADVLKDMKSRAMIYAVKHDDLPALQIMQKNGAALSPQLATDLLWAAILSKSSQELVQFLIKNGAEITNKRSGFMPLIKAASLNNMPAVKALVQSGADVNAFVDVQIGSALQQALENGYTDIELYLRDKGARE